MTWTVPAIVAPDLPDGDVGPPPHPAATTARHDPAISVLVKDSIGFLS